MDVEKDIKQRDIQLATLKQILNNNKLKQSQNSNSFKLRRSDMVYDYVVRNICNRKFKGGIKLLERELAEQLDLSHIPIREAIRKLEHDGWIIHEPHKGATIRKFTEIELGEIYTVRDIIDCGSIRMVAKDITYTQLAELKRVVDLIIISNETNNFDVYQDADFEFHRLIVEYAQSERLLAFYETLIAQMKLCCFEYWRIGREDQSFQVESLQSTSVTHKMIYDALVEHHVEWAEQLLRKHLMESRSMNLEALGKGTKQGKSMI